MPETRPYTPSDVQPSKKSIPEKIVAVGSTVGSLIERLDITRTGPYQRIKQGFRTLDERLTELEDREDQKSEKETSKQKSKDYLKILKES